MAKTGKFRCSACGRVFSMAMHLGRHTRTVHAPKGIRMARAAGGGRSAAAGLTSSDRIPQLLGQLTAYHDELVAQRATIDAEIAMLVQVIDTLGGSVAKSKAKPRVRRRGQQGPAVRRGSLRAYIQQVMQAHPGPIATREVAAAVLRAGYKSVNKELPKSIGKLLRAMPSVVRVGLGVFRMK